MGLILLGLLSAPPARAQQSQGHYWQISYAQSGDNSDDIRDVPNPGDLSHQNYPLPAYTTGSAGGGGGGSNKINGSVTDTISATLTWVPATGQNSASDPPPIQVHIKEYSHAWEQSLGSGSGGGTADDGMGDPPDSSSGGQQSQGIHLIVKNGSSGTIALDAVTVKASNATSNWVTGYPGGGGGGGYPGSGGYGYWDTTGGERSAGFSVVVDTDPNPRSVEINSSIDPTYHKDSAVGKQANVAALDGTMTADSCVVNPPDGSPGFLKIDYIGYPKGSWADGSMYHWYSAQGSDSASGAFYPLNNFSVPYGGDNAGGGAGSQEHINLHCTDANDGAQATANYYIKWHDEWEPVSWPPDGPAYKVMGPDAANPSWPAYPWEAVAPVSGLNFPNPSLMVTYQEAGIESVDGALELGAEPVVLHFGVSGRPKDTMTVTQNLTPSPPLAQGEETWAVHREFVNRTTGHLDHYNTHGYSGPGIWRHDEMKGIDLNYYTPYQSTGAAASDPSPGWNPPGYH